MEILARHYQVLSPSDALATLADAGRLARKSVLVTFDDGYRDFAQNAWPVMKSLGLPVSLFVPTSYPDAPRNVFWWDRLHRMITRTKRSQITGTPLGDLSLESAQERQLAVRRLQDFLKLQSDASHPARDRPTQYRVRGSSRQRQRHPELERASVPGTGGGRPRSAYP